MMPYKSGQIVFLKPRRICEVATGLIVLFFIYLVFEQWASRPVETIEQNALLFKRQAFPHENAANQGAVGRSELPKYIHLDLKGAPPKAEKFYGQFFEFLSKLQMGIKGVIMEYEDTLPLEGNLKDVSTTRSFSNNHLPLK